MFGSAYRLIYLLFSRDDFARWISIIDFPSFHFIFINRRTEPGKINVKNNETRVDRLERYYLKNTDHTMAKQRRGNSIIQLLTLKRPRIRFGATPTSAIRWPSYACSWASAPRIETPTFAWASAGSGSWSCDRCHPGWSKRICWTAAADSDAAVAFSQSRYWRKGRVWPRRSDSPPDAGSRCSSTRPSRSCARPSWTTSESFCNGPLKTNPCAFPRTATPLIWNPRCSDRRRSKSSSTIADSPSIWLSLGYRHHWSSTDAAAAVAVAGVVVASATSRCSWLRVHTPLG